MSQITETTDAVTFQELWTNGPDWDCQQCQSVNAAHREKCRICGLDSALMSGGCYFPVGGV